jgi:cytosine/uracil/thiamine/allantoin permease
MSDDRAASLWNPDLAPTGPEQRTWAWYHFAALWIGMIDTRDLWLDRRRLGGSLCLC